MQELQLSRIKGVVLYGLLISISSGAMFGYSTGVTSFIYSNMASSNQFKFIKQNATVAQSLFNASIVFGAFIGCPIFGIVADKFGRKRALYIGDLLALIGTSLSIVYPDFWLIFAGRLLVGLSLGSYSTIGPIYLSETSPDDMRFLGVFFQFSITFTIFLAAFGAFAINGAAYTWRIMFAFNYVPIVLCTILGILAPESPRYLVKTNVDEARDLFGQIYDDPEKIEREISSIQEKYKEKVSWTEMFEPQNLKKLGLGAILAATLQLTGINAIIYYMNDVSKSIISSADGQAWFAVGMMGLNSVSSLVSIYVASLFGRRTILLVAQVFMMVSLALTSIGFFLPNQTASQTISVIFIGCFIITFELGIGGLFFVLMTEIFPERLRSRVGSIMNSLQWGFNLILTVSFAFIANAFNGQIGYIFIIFTGIGLVTLVIQFFFLPETKGKSFDEIDEDFKKGV